MGAGADFPDDVVVSEIDLNCKAVCLICNHAIPYMKPGERICASSFGKAGENGSDRHNGIRVTFFDDNGVVAVSIRIRSMRNFRQTVI